MGYQCAFGVLQAGSYSVAQIREGENIRNVKLTNHSWQLHFFRANFLLLADASVSQMQCQLVVLLTHNMIRCLVIHVQNDWWIYYNFTVRKVSSYKVEKNPIRKRKLSSATGVEQCKSSTTYHTLQWHYIYDSRAIILAAAPGEHLPYFPKPRQRVRSPRHEAVRTGRWKKGVKLRCYGINKSCGLL